jgi:hypothetical protein
VRNPKTRVKFGLADRYRPIRCPILDKPVIFGAGHQHDLSAMHPWDLNGLATHHAAQGAIQVLPQTAEAFVLGIHGLTLPTLYGIA